MIFRFKKVFIYCMYGKIFNIGHESTSRLYCYINHCGVSGRGVSVGEI